MKLLEINKYKNFFMYLVIFFTGLIFLIYSPLHPLRREGCYKDSSVFKTIALMMSKGFVPYKDSFDHKGILLYFLNYLGLRINYYCGIWFIELLFITLTLIFSYKTINIFIKSKVYSYILLLSIYSLLYTFFEGGNLTEEYAMAFICISLYYFTDYFINNNISNTRLIILGASFAFTFLLRPNMIAIWLVGILAYGICSIKSKRFVRDFLLILIGCALIVVPITLYLVFNNAFFEFINDYFVFNFRYSNYYPAFYDSLKARVISLRHFLSYTLVEISLMIVMFLFIIKRNLLTFFLLLYFFINLVFVCFSGHIYGHYGMVIIPSLILPLSIAMSSILKVKEKIFHYICMIVLVLVFIYKSMFNSMGYNLSCILKNSGNEYNLSYTTSSIVKLIEENTSKSDKILVYGNKDIYYVISKRVHATRYSFQPGSMSKRMSDEFWSQLNAERPKLIIVSRTDDVILKFLNGNNYKLIYPNNEQEADKVYILK